MSLPLSVLSIPVFLFTRYFHLSYLTIFLFIFYACVAFLSLFFCLSLSVSLFSSCLSLSLLLFLSLSLSLFFFLIKISRVVSVTTTSQSTHTACLLSSVLFTFHKQNMTLVACSARELVIVVHSLFTEHRLFLWLVCFRSFCSLFPQHTGFSWEF